MPQFLAYPPRPDLPALGGSSSGPEPPATAPLFAGDFRIEADPPELRLLPNVPAA